MQVKTLRKFLQKLERKGHGHKPVVCAAKEMVERYNDVFDIIDVKSIGLEFVPTGDGDGFLKHRLDGAKCGRHCVILS